MRSLVGACIAAIVAGFLICASQAQYQSFPPGVFTNKAAADPSSVTYQGPGDIVSGALLWGSCARAYNLAYANGTNPLCDLVAVTGGAAVCTLRVATTGFVDLAASYCAGTTPSAACAAASGGSCKVTKVYDQTGNGNHFTNVTLASMPALTFNALGGLPGLTYAVGNSTFLATGNVTASFPFSESGVITRTSNTAAVNCLLCTSTGTAIEFGLQNSANTALLLNNTGTITATANDSTFHAMQGVTAGTGGASSVLMVDGTATTGTTSNNPIMAVPVRLGRGNSCCSLTGTIMEGGIWSSTTFAAGDRTNINNNQHGATSGYNF